MRRIMISMVLATDMARHFKDLKKFEELVRVNGPDVQASGVCVVHMAIVTGNPLDTRLFVFDVTASHS